MSLPLEVVYDADLDESYALFVTSQRLHVEIYV
jgi:hypothetical protein